MTSHPEPEPLTQGQEMELYECDRPAWLQYAAPRIAQSLRLLSGDRLQQSWAFLKPDTQYVVWVLLDEPTRSRIVERFCELPDEALCGSWSRLLRETQIGLWQLLPEETQDRIRELKQAGRR